MAEPMPAAASIGVKSLMPNYSLPQKKYGLKYNALKSFA